MVSVFLEEKKRQRGEEVRKKKSLLSRPRPLNSFPLLLTFERLPFRRGRVLPGALRAQHRPAQPRHRALERQPRPRRRLVEQRRHHPPFELPRGRRPDRDRLHLARGVEDEVHALAGELLGLDHVADAEVAPVAGEGGRAGRGPGGDGGEGSRRRRRERGKGGGRAAPLVVSACRRRPPRRRCLCRSEERLFRRGLRLRRRHSKGRDATSRVEEHNGCVRELS